MLNIYTYFYISHTSVKWSNKKKQCIQMSNHYVVYLKSAYNAGDPSSIPGLERSSGEGIGYPLQYSWASLVAQKLKNLPAMRETWVWPLVGKIPWRRAWSPPLQYACLENPHGWGAWWATVYGVAKRQTRPSN